MSCISRGNPDTIASVCPYRFTKPARGSSDSARFSVLTVIGAAA